MQLFSVSCNFFMSHTTFSIAYAICNFFSTLTEAWIPLESLLMMIGALAGLPVYFLLRYMLATGDDNTASSQEGDVQLHYGGVPLQEEP